MQVEMDKASTLRRVRQGSSKAGGGKQDDSQQQQPGSSSKKKRKRVGEGGPIKTEREE